MRSLLMLLALLPTIARGEFLTLPEYRKGLKELRGHFEKRGEDPRVAERYIAGLEAAFPVKLGERVPVTRDAFAAFLRYQAAWARKTRDGKNPNISAAQLKHEVDRAARLKEEFKALAEAQCPAFYRAFQAAVQDVRRLKHRDGREYAGTSAIFFHDQVDDSYSHVDAGNEALEKGAPAKAIDEANLALAINPGNADALVLRAGAEYDQRNFAEAIADAQSALVLDPVNQQARAILSLTAESPAAAKAAMAGAAAVGANLAGDGRRAGLPRLDDRIDESARGDGLFAGAPSATPAVGKILAEDLSIRAVGLAKEDPRESLGQLGQAMALDPRNASARDWHATLANRAGDYPAALGSAERGLRNDPNDALAYYNKAYALAGSGDKVGMEEALKQAARLDPKYQRALAQAQAPNFTPDEATELLFGASDNQYQPEIPLPRHAKSSPVLLMLGFLGVLFALGGVAIFFGPSRSVVDRS